jgi:hypothetical protein
MRQRLAQIQQVASLGCTRTRNKADATERPGNGQTAIGVDETRAGARKCRTGVSAELTAIR